MTLYTLVASTIIQGNVRISAWDGETEKVVATWENCEQLWSGEIEEEWEDFEVKYIFASPDGYLHIECETER